MPLSAVSSFSAGMPSLTAHPFVRVSATMRLRNGCYNPRAGSSPVQGRTHRPHAKGIRMGNVIGWLSAAFCIGAGVYLLQYNGATTGLAGGTSWFQIIGHGMGIYFIGKGLYVGRSTWLQAEQADRLKQLVELGAHERAAQAARPAREPWAAD